MHKISSLLPVALAGLSLLIPGIGRADNVFVSSNGNNSVEEIIDNQVTQFIFNSPNLAGPTGLALDSQGNLYVANNSSPGSGFIAKFSPTGAFIENVATGLSNPRGLVFDSAGNLFVANQSGNSITEIPAGGGSATTVVTGLSFPNGLTFDAAGNLYVTNGANKTVDKISFSGGSATTTPFITSGLADPNGVVAVTSGLLAGDILVVDKGSSTVLAFDSNGNLLPSNPFIDDANPNDIPKYIAVDSAGDFYVTDAGDNHVTEYGPDGTFIRVFTTDVDGNSAFSGACAVITQQLVVPEPSTYALLLGGAAMLVFLARRKRMMA